MRFRAHYLSSRRCRAGTYGTLGSALHQAHHCRWHYRNAKSCALCTQKGGFLSQFQPKARGPSMSLPKLFTLQHLQTAKPQPAKATTPGAPPTWRSPIAVVGSRAGPSTRAAAGTRLGVCRVSHFAGHICLVIRETTHSFQLR